jgi:hypothetical protein
MFYFSPRFFNNLKIPLLCQPFFVSNVLIKIQNNFELLQVNVPNCCIAFSTQLFKRVLSTYFDSLSTDCVATVAGAGCGRQTGPLPDADGSAGREGSVPRRAGGAEGAAQVDFQARPDQVSKPTCILCSWTDI